MIERNKIELCLKDAKHVKKQLLRWGQQFDVFVLRGNNSRVLVKPFLKLHNPSSNADHSVVFINVSDELLNYSNNLGLNKEEMIGLLKESFLNV